MTKRNAHQQSTYIECCVKSGLSLKAAAVYVALLEAGAPISPKNMIIRTGLHRQYAYDAIRELQERALIASTGKDRAVRYHALSPGKLVQEIEKKRIDTLNGVQTLMQLYLRSTDASGEEISLDPVLPSGTDTDIRLASIERSLHELKEAIERQARPGREHTV